MNTKILRVAPFVLSAAIAFGIIYADDAQKARRQALGELVRRAEAGDMKSLYDLAYLYDTGYDSIPVDSAKSTALYRISAEKGYAPAQNYLGFRYYNGEFVKQDIDSAIYWIRKAADAGDVKAAGNLGFLYSESEVMPHDYQEALKWYTKAADAGLPTALSQLADMYRAGRGTTPDTLKAVSLYEQAITSGLPDAELKLMAMMGYKWKELSPDSALVLGKKYYTHGAPIAGTELLETASLALLPEALALMGDAYSRGYGVPYDHTRSIRLYLLAALKRNIPAQYIISELLDFFPDTFSQPELLELLNEEFPEGIPQEINEAEYWRAQAAEGGVDSAEKAYEVLLYPE